MDDRDVHAFRPELVGQVLRHRCHRDIAHRPDRRAGAAGSKTADADDAAPAGGDHTGCDRLRAAQVAHHLHVDVGPEGIRGDLGQGWRPGLAARRRRAVDQDVYSAHQIPCPRGHASHRGIVAGVDLDCVYLTAAGAEVSGRPRQGLRGPRRDRYLGALCEQRGSRRLADAAAASRYQSPPSGQMQIHWSPP